MAINQFPPVPPVNTIQPVLYNSNGRSMSNEGYIDTSVKQGGGLGADFSNLIGSNVSVSVPPIVTEAAPPKKKKKKKTTEDGSQSTDIVVSETSPVSSKEIVENTVYADTYNNTNMLTYGVIAQADELLYDCKQDLDYIRSQRNMKGKYHYVNSTIASMSSLLGTKLAAIKEINSTIKTVNDNEYRRFKDMRALDNTDDNKAIMDAYTAFISAPVGAPAYQTPTTMQMTAGFDNIIRADYPADIQKNMDVGMARYLSNLTPEENLMLVDNNQDVEEVLVYDQATGAKKFQWMNTRTGEILYNMPASSELILEDFVIDPRTKLAKNTNLNMIKKVVVLNEGSFDKF